MAALIQLPPELVSNLLGFLDPEDLARVNLTCKYLYYAIKDNQSLFRAVYLNHLDDPGTNDVDWVQEVQDLVKLKCICSSSDPTKGQYLPFVYHTTTRLLSRSKSSNASRPRLSAGFSPTRNVQILRQCFSTPSTQEAFLCQSFLFQRARAPVKTFSSPKGPPSDERQMSAKLHCLFGDMILNYGRTRSGRTYPFACSKVYDIREYTQNTRWGPFLDEGPGPVGAEGNEEGQTGLPEDKVDWEKVEAIMIVLGQNLKNTRVDHIPVFQQFWGVKFPGSWPKSYVPLPMNREITSLDMQDPYNVTGTWLRVVCFLDYNDFFAYNFPTHDDLPAHLPRPFLDRMEATRLIILKIHVTSIEPPGPEDGQALPVVHFAGLSRSLESRWDTNANSELRGTVRLTREGEVRWTTFSIFNGSKRWRSEGIQLGGLQSSKVVGNWFDKDYSPSGPCGPTAFWKIGDRHPNVDDLKITVHDYLPVFDGYEYARRGFPRRSYDEEYVSTPLGILQQIISNPDVEGVEIMTTHDFDGEEDEDDDEEEEASSAEDMSENEEEEASSAEDMSENEDEEDGDVGGPPPEVSL